MLLSAPTSTFHTLWDVKMSGANTAGQEGIVDAPRQECWGKSRKFCFCSLEHVHGGAEELIQIQPCTAVPHHTNSSKIQRFGASEEQIQQFPCKYSHRNSFCSTRDAADFWKFPWNQEVQIGEVTQIGSGRALSPSVPARDFLGSGFCPARRFQPDRATHHHHILGPKSLLNIF